MDRKGDEHYLNDNGDNGDGDDDDDMPMTFVDLLRELVDIIAGTIESYEKFIATNFGGKEKLVQLLLPMQKLCDEMSLQVFNQMNDQRGIREKFELIERRHYGAHGHGHGHSHGMKHAHAQQQSKLSAKSIDTRELDLILDEMVAMSSIVIIFEQFMKSKFAFATERGVNNHTNHHQMTSPMKSNQGGSSGSSTVSRPLSELMIKMTEVMEHYKALERYFMKRSIEIAVELTYNEIRESVSNRHKSHQSRNGMMMMNDMNEYGGGDMYGGYGGGGDHGDDDNSDDDSDDEDDELDDTQKCAPVVEDTFFILQKSLNRAVSSNNIPVIGQVVNDVNMLLQELFKEKVENLIRNELTKYKGINSLELAQTYVLKLKRDFDRMCEEQWEDVNDRKKLNSYSSEFITTSQRFLASVTKEMKLLAKLRIKPKLNLINNWDKGISMQQFIDELEYATIEFKHQLTTNNFDRLIQEMVIRLTKKMEENIMQRYFSFSDALKLDSDIRSLMLYLSDKTQTVVRDKFAALNQISFLLKVTSPDEVEEYWNDDAGMMAINLPPADIKKILRRRTDLNPTEIDSLFQDRTQ